MSEGNRESLLDVQVWSGRTPGCPGVVGTPSRMSECGRQALPDDRVVERPSRMSDSDQEVLSDVREWLGHHPGCPNVVGRHYQMSVSG